MSLQSTNRVNHAKVRETTFAVIPTNPAFQTMRVTSSALNANPQTIESDEIRSDRQVSDLILVGTQAQGSIGGEMSFGNADLDLEEALQGTWSNKPSIVNVAADTQISDLSATVATVSAGGASFTTGTLALLQGFTTSANNKKARVVSSTGTTITFPAATFAVEAAAIPVAASIRAVGFQGASGDITAEASGLGSTVLDFTTFGLVIGEWVKVGGSAAGEQFATAVNNDFCRISAISANDITFDIVPAGWATDAGTSKTISVFFGDVLRNGSTQRSLTIERQYLDHSPVSYEYISGLVANRFSLSLDAQKIATYSVDYMGQTGTTTTTRASGATDLPASTGDVLNTSSNVGRLGFNGSVIGSPNYMMSATIQVDNNSRYQNAIGNIGAVAIGTGEFAVTGTMDFYFGNTSIYEAVLSNTAVSLDFRVGRGDGNKPALLFDLPRVKFASGSPSVQGKNQDVRMSAGYQAIRHPTLLYTMHVGRYWFLE